MKLILVVLFCIIADMAHGQQTINKVKVNDLNLPQESASSALTIDATKKVKASATVSDTELSYLDGVTSSVQTQINSKAADSSVVKLTGDQSISGVKTFTGKTVASSTTNGFTPCPVMTQAQRDALTPSSGDCVYNSTSLKWNIYNGTTWKEAGGGAGGTRLQLMTDPSFEEGVTEGSCTTCTASSESSIVLVTPTNEKSGRAAFTASTGYYNLSKSTTAQFVGIQGVVSCRIKTDQAGVKFKAYVDGSNAGTAQDTIDVVSDSKWNSYEIPIVFGSTSAGWRIDATSSITGSIYFDECGVIVGAAMPEVAQAQLAVDAYIAGTANCTGWARTSTTLGAFSSDADCPGPTIALNNVGQAQTTDSDLPRFTVNNLPAGQYKATFISASFMSVSAANSMSIFDGTTSCAEFNSNTDTSTGQTTFSCTFNYTSSGNRSFELYARSASSTVNIQNDTGTGYSRNLRFILEYYPPASKIYSQQNNTDTDWVDCGLTTADFTGFGTVTNIEDLCKKEGTDLLMRVKYTTGTVTATEARLNLRLAGTALTAANSTIIPSIALSGQWTHVASNVYMGTILTEPSVGYVTFGISGAVNQGLTKGNGNTLFASSAATSIEARIPIAGWTKTQITGTFANVVTAPGISKPRTCYYAFGGASATLAVPTVCSTGTCVEVIDTCASMTPPTFASTGLYQNLTIASGTFANSSPLFCQAYGYAAASAGYALMINDTGDNDWSTNSSGGAVLNIAAYSSAPAAQNRYVQVKCEGQAP